MLNYVMKCDIRPQIKHNEFYLSTKWRVRKQFIDYEIIVIDHPEAMQHTHRLHVFNILMGCLAPQALAPVRTLLSCHGTPVERR